MLTSSDLTVVIEQISGASVSLAGRILGESRSSVWIGSGLAKIAAMYGASMTQKAGVPSRFVSPLEYVQNSRISCLPVLVSLRGNHEDAVKTAESIVSRDCSSSIILTGQLPGAAEAVLTKDLVRRGAVMGTAVGTLPDRDRRFVNFKSILMLSAVANRLVDVGLGHNADCQLELREIEAAWIRARQTAGRIFDQICAVEEWQSRQLIILSEGGASDVAATWQAILSEAGIINPLCLDLKDYTHGDHLVASRTRRAMYLVIGHNKINSVFRTFIERFSAILPVLPLELSGHRKYHFWENLFVVGGVTSALSGVLGYYNKRPPKDPLVWGWRGWGSIEPAGE